VRLLLSGASCLSVVFLCLQVGSPAQTGSVRKPVTHHNIIQLQTPTASQAVSGTVQLTLSGDLSKVASVCYKLGNYRFAYSTQSPFSAYWNSALASDGNSQIEAVVYDAFGGVLSDTFTPVVLANYGNKAEVLNGGLPGTMTGQVTLKLHAYDSVHYPAYWTSAIDGEILTPLYTDQAGKNDNSVSQPIDTTIYPNGLREFYFAFHSNDFNNPSPPPGNENYRGMVMQYVDIENGRTFMDVVARYLHVYTSVGGSVALGCSRTYTNGDQDACLAPQWVANDPTVVSIDASGNLQGLKEGYTDVTLTEGGKTTAIHAWVKNDPGLPHFTANGGMSTTYTAGQSTFIVAPFLLASNYVSADPNLLAEVRRAGINTLTQGMYINSSDMTTSFVAWLSGYNTTVLPSMQYAAANGFRVIGTGDNIARNIGVEAYRSMNWPSAKQAIQYAFQQFALSGTAVSVEMIDEAGFLWGPNPTPPGLLGAANSMQSIACAASSCTVTWPNLTDNSYHDVISNGLTFSLTGNPALNSPVGTTYTVQNATANTFTFTPAAPVTRTFTQQTDPATEFEWFARANTCSGAPCVPLMPDSSLATITSWAKSASPTVPVSFPAGGTVNPPDQRNWIGQGSLSDYASQYWDTGQLRPTYVFGKGIRESNYWMLNAYYQRQPYMQLNRPQLMLIGISDNAYVKNSPVGTDGYNPPVDQLVNVGVVPKTVASTMFSAVAAGAAGLRLYQFETSDDHQAEVAGGPGGSYQTGAAPSYGAVNLWRGMGYGGALLTNVLQPYVLSPPASSPAFGRNIVTGVRKSANGTMLIIVNGWDNSRTISVDFTPYKFGFGATRYRVNDSYIYTSLLPDSNGESISMASGETLVYIFPNSNAPSGLDSVAFLPVPPVGNSRMAVTYNYLYQQNVVAFGTSVDCTAGCMIPVDRRIGDVFFQYTLIDPVTGQRRASEVKTLGGANSVRIPVRFK
jgi:hypothetical protein